MDEHVSLQEGTDQGMVPLHILLHGALSQVTGLEDHVEEVGRVSQRIQSWPEGGTKADGQRSGLPRWAIRP